jgi:aldose 1-epimerase
MIDKIEWGFADGYKTYLITLKNKNGMSVSLTNYGAAIVELSVPDKNNGDNCLHGGSVSYGKRVWSVYGISDGDCPSAAFLYVSPDGEENFPGEVRIIVRYMLTDNNSLALQYSAISDADTVVNLTNHAYFNLGGHDSGDILDTKLQIFAENYTPFDDAQIPTGEISPVKNTALDFTAPKFIGGDVNSGKTDGYDNNFILGEPGVMRKAAVAYNINTGIEMTTYTDMPAMQLYTANHLGEPGKGGFYYGKFGGFCLETQFTPNTPNLPAFPQCVIKKGEEFRFTTEYAFSVN